MKDSEHNLERLLKAIEKEITEKEDYKIRIKEWIGTYQGKIMAFQVADDSYYLVFKKDGSINIRKGEYPSSDVFFRGSYEDMEGVLMGDMDPKNLINQSRLFFHGNYNEFVPFKRLINPQRPSRTAPPEENPLP